MKKAYTKDILRTIRKNAKRFAAIVAITALGMTVYAGITAACADMYQAADRYYDRQRLFDIQVLSTLGLTDGDVGALQAIDGVETACGGYIEKVYTTIGDVRHTADMTMISPTGQNKPYVLQGRLPEAPGEVAVTQRYLDESGKLVGDTLEIEEALDIKEEERDDTSKEEPAGGDDAVVELDWEEDFDLGAKDEAPTFPQPRYAITGVVSDPMNISTDKKGTARRFSSASEYTFYITPSDVDTEYYTVIYLGLAGMSGLDCYSQEYKNTVQAVIDDIEANLIDRREQARYDTIVLDATTTLGDAERRMNDKFAEIDQQLADAWAELEDGRQALLNGEAELNGRQAEAQQQLAGARAAIEDTTAQLRAAAAQLDTGDAPLEEKAAELAEARRLFEENRPAAEAGFAQGEALLAQKQEALDLVRGLLTSTLEELKARFSAWPQDAYESLVSAVSTKAAEILTAQGGESIDISEGSEAMTALLAATEIQRNAFATALEQSVPPPEEGGEPPAETDFGTHITNAVNTALGLGILEGGQQVLDTQKAALDAQKAAFSDVDAQLTAGEAQLASARQQLADARQQVGNGWAALAQGEAELNANETLARQEMANAREALEEKKRELADGEAKLRDNEEAYHQKRQEAEDKLADAYAELDKILMPQWYVQDRTALDSYSSMDSDLGSIYSIGQGFPILFIVVAILISLTTMTRLVEEERGLIGTYKALGFSNPAIGWKYIFYALSASLLGSFFGCAIGYFALPRVVVWLLGSLYTIPDITMLLNFPQAVCGILLFVLCNVAATAFACRNELKQVPAALMRPKAPKAGSRILLERIPALWNRIGFLGKVTVRNLFRYKKRFFMTVIGIAGCTALVLAGFAIRDSVNGLMPRQYAGVYHYDWLVAANPGGEDDLATYLEGDDDLADYLSVRIERVKVFNAEGTSESLQMVVVPNSASLGAYIDTNDMSGTPVEADGNGVLITQNAAEKLGLSAGDTATIQNLQLQRQDAAVKAVTENYLGNSLYISQQLYEDLFGEYKANAAYAHFTSAVTDPVAFAEGMLDEEYIMSSASTPAMREQFFENNAVMNSVVYILTFLAAGLAFVVLFTLSNTNISERQRELATIKVLGFYDKEVHSYVNKETLLLTVIGIACGLPLGYLLSGLLLAALKMPAIQFVLAVQPTSYVFAAAISLSFALVVNLLTNRVLNRINMVEALKSVE